MIFRILLEPQGGEGGSGSGNATTEATTAAKGPDLSKAAEGLVAKHGDPTAALLVLLGENYSLRDKNRELGGKVPGADAVVLAGDQAKEWEHYRNLGKPSDLKAALAEREQYKAEAGTFRKAEVIRSAAELHGYRPGVLGTLAKDLEITIGDRVGKDGKPALVDGKPVKAALVKGEGEAMVPLDEHASAAWADFLPALKAEERRPVGTPNPNGAPNPARHRMAQAVQGDAQPKRVRSAF